MLGGLTVLTDLNPWLVALHFLLSTAIIAATFLLWWRLRRAPGGGGPAGPRVPRRRAHGRWPRSSLVAGTVVTGSGPHAGDLKNGRVHRIDLPIAGASQLHADLVMVLIGLTVGVARARADALARRSGCGAPRLVLLGVELAQGVIGYTQYFLHVPPLLVGAAHARRLPGLARRAAGAAHRRGRSRE